MLPIWIAVTVLDFVIPGYAWILITGVAERLSLLGKISFSFLFSICFLSLLTEALSLVTGNYLSYSAILALAPIAFIVTRMLRRPGSLSLRIGMKGTMPVAIVILAYSVIVAVDLWSTPFYPSAVTIDPSHHFQLVELILQGAGRSMITQSSYPVGLNFVAALFASITSTSAIESLRIVLSFVLLDALVLVYVSAQVILGSEKYASLALLVAAFAIPVDLILLTWLGLYPNLVGNAIVLAILWVVASYITKPSWQLGANLAILPLAGAFIHSSVLIFPAVMCAFLPVVFFLFRPKFRVYSQAFLFSVSGLAFFAGIFRIIEMNFTRILEHYVLGFNTFNLIGFSAIYVSLWGYLHLYVGSVGVFVIGAAIVSFAILRRNHLTRTLVVTWTILLFIVPFLTAESWRLTLFALLPAPFLAGNLIALPSESSRMRATLHGASLRAFPYLILLLLILSGAFPGIVARTYDPTMRARQTAIIDSMRWLSQHQCGGGVLSVGLYDDYRYVETLVGVHYGGDFVMSASALFDKSAALGSRCIAVSAQNPFLETFESSALFEEKYRNSFVVIFLNTAP
jgi:hypothetical protein